MIDLEAIKARAQAATPGEWYVERCGDFDDPSFIIAGVVRDRYGDNALNCGSDEALGQFIAHARTDVPALVAEVERLTAERDIWQERAHNAEEALDRLKALADSIRAKQAARFRVDL